MTRKMLAGRSRKGGAACFLPLWIPALMTLAHTAFALPPPQTKVENVTETLHGVSLTDPYRWLEDQNSPQTRAWLQEQEAYRKTELGNFAGRGTLAQKLSRLLKIDTISAPSEHGGYYFYMRRKAEQDQPVFFRRKGKTGKEEILIDVNTLSPDHSTSVNLLDISEDGSILVYGLQIGGKDEQTIHLLDCGEKKDLADTLPEYRYFGGVSITPDKKTLYYGRLEKEGPRIRKHILGTDSAADPEIFGKGYDSGKIVGQSVSENGKWLTLTVFYGSAGSKTEVYVKNLETDGEITPIVNDLDARFNGQVVEDTLYLQTDWNAPNNRILSVNLYRPQREHWKEIVPTGDSVINGFSLTGGKLFVATLENVTSKIKIYSPTGGQEGEVKLPGLGTATVPTGRWNRDEAYFTYASFATPRVIYRYSVKTGEAGVWAKLNIPVKSDQTQVDQVFYASKDGTKIPMFLVYKKGLKKDGTHPVYLTAYGGFNVSQSPYFSAVAALWAEAGGVYAVANLRGGGEYGEAWHRAGMLEKKQNVFDDFIAAGEWLISSGYTQSEKLAITGGSNGGLLMGAMLTQRPELFGAVICSVPLLDMIRYHQFLVARFWVPEYGSSENAEQFPYLLKYSPYQNVKPGTKFPATLFVSGDSDTRVAPLHARKMTALLQASNGGDKPILLQYDTKGGHAGGKPINKTIEDTADQLAFLFWQLNIPVK